MTTVNMKRGSFETELHTARTQCEDEGRNWGDGQKLSDAKDSQPPPEARRKTCNDSLSQPSKGTNPATL